MEGKESESHQYSIMISSEEEYISYMEKKIKEVPELLKVSAGGSSCCIFRVPQPLFGINRKAYLPEIVSIGPYHHGRYHLEVIEEHKWRFLGSLINRKKEKGPELELACYFEAIKKLEMKARECYSETICLSSNYFVQTMVLDGCFIIELLRKAVGIVDKDPDDPIFNMPWVMPVLRRDLLKLENQLPLLVLQQLFDLSRDPEKEDVSLSMLALKFFNDAVSRPEEDLQRYSTNGESKHLLDLYRSSFIPPTEKEPKSYNSLALLTKCARKLFLERSDSSENKHLLDLYRSCFLPSTEEGLKTYNPPARLIQCATKLRASGIKFEPRKTDTFLDIKFRKPVLEIPPITINDFTSSSFLNAIAFEQCHQGCSKHITTYAVFMDCLINSPSDVGFLYDDKVIAEFSGNNQHVAYFFNELGRYVTWDVRNCYLSKQIEDIEKYYRGQWATVMRVYFHTPWSFMSAFSALILLCLTLAQTFFTIYPFIRRSL